MVEYSINQQIPSSIVSMVKLSLIRIQAYAVSILIILSQEELLLKNLDGTFNNKNKILINLYNRILGMVIYTGMDTKIMQNSNYKKVK
jgi:hypothetical protein